jgi:hypothetical protein
VGLSGVDILRKTKKKENTQRKQTESEGDTWKN